MKKERMAQPQAYKMRSVPIALRKTFRQEKDKFKKTY